MKLWVKILSFIFLFYLIIQPKNVEARSGCCSHHGGVCGCRCCDGSSLSATCAPYYPSCGGSGTIKTVIQPTRTPAKIIPTKIPTIKPIIPTKKPTLAPTLIPTKTKISTPTPSKSEISPTIITNPAKVLETSADNSTKPASSDNPLGGLIVLSGLGFSGYKLVKKFKK